VSGGLRQQLVTILSGSCGRKMWAGEDDLDVTGEGLMSSTLHSSHLSCCRSDFTSLSRCIGDSRSFIREVRIKWGGRCIECWLSSKCT
jgi:hypothetical protein